MSPSPPRALVVAPDRDDARALVVFLRASGFHVEWARDDESAANVLAGDRVDVLVGELDAPHIDGLSLLTDARFRDRDVCAVLVADATDSPAALEAMRRGAYDV